jgi:hypothetical protein
MKLMRRASIVIIFAWSTLAHSALAPSAVNVRDLETMVDFVGKHQFVAMTLESINLVSLTIFYNNNCEAKFSRIKPSLLNLGRPGPQPRIVFKSSSCSLTETDQNSNE